jgi:ribosome-associated toxin RatA of RatAB toxin-antitoxin module
MKELHGTASGAVQAPVEDCFRLLEAVDGYPGWYPEVVREVEVLERDGEGRPATVRTTLHVAHGPLTRDFRLVMAVTKDPPKTVALSRVPNDAGDPEEFAVTWTLEPAASTRIRLDLDANLSVPRLLPLGGLGDSLAQGFIAAARKALGGGSG